MLGDDSLQPEAFVQLTDQNEAGVRGDARSLKGDLQKAVEGELERLGFFLTQRVSPFWQSSSYRNPQKSRRDGCFAGEGTTTKSQIRAKKSTPSSPR